jgi:hypothetical protein
MDMSFDERLTAYRLVMSHAKVMLHRGIISSCDYDRIDDLMAEKYGFSSISIYR